MDKITSQRILNEAIRIGDELLEQTETDKDGMAWQTMNSTGSGDTAWGKSENIYTGVSGISIFLLQLYRSTGEIKYLKAAEGGMKWVDNSCKKNPANSYAFITGRMGVSFAMLRMYEVTDKKEYLRKALRIGKNCPLPNTYGADDLISGSAGTLLALLHLHSACKEKWILDKIDNYIKHLLKKVNAGKRGLYWDRIPGYISGLCGFSHGAAGMGFVFLELGHYFNNPAFYWIAEQAFLYESALFSKKIMNWPDLRKFKDTDEDFKRQENAFLEGNMNFFTNIGDMNAWCHGAAGIGLSRLRAYELLKNKLYKHETDIAVRKTVDTDILNQNSMVRSYTYCHGKGGNAELFLEAYKIFKKNEYLTNSEKIALEALKSKEETGIYHSGYGYASAENKEGRSLFMGNAGIGYFYLKLLNPLNTPSILNPKLDKTFKNQISAAQYPFIKISIEGIKKKVVYKTFKRTMIITDIMMKNEIDRHFAAPRPNRIDETNEFVKFIKNKFTDLKPEEKRFVSDIFTLELTRLKMDRSTASNAYLDMKSVIVGEYSKKILRLNRKSFSELHFKLAPDVKLHKTKWNWNIKSEPAAWVENTNFEPSQNYYILKSTAKGVDESVITSFVYYLTEIFQNWNKIGRAINIFLKHMNGADISINEIKKISTNQLKQLVSYGVIVPSDFKNMV